MNFHDARTAVACAATVTWMTAAAGAQSVFIEGFNDNGQTPDGQGGPANLIEQGWTFSNQSEPQGTYDWHDNTLGLPLFEGASCLAASVYNVDGAGTISNWAVLPDLPLAEGQVLTVALQGSQNRVDGVQIRYSPTGGTDTGVGAFDVGDFTTLLLDTFPLNEMDWEVFQVAIPGPGRIALRRFLDPGGLETPYGTYLRVDALSIDVPEPPDPPTEIIFAAGDSPHVIDDLLLVPANTHLIVEPGAVVEIVGDGRIQVEGRLIAHGTPDEPVPITAPFVYVPAAPIESRQSGVIDFKHVIFTGGVVEADATLLLEPGATGPSVIAESCQFVSALLRTHTLQGGPQFVSVTDCQFTGEGTQVGIMLRDGQLALRNTTFADGNIVSVVRGYLLIDGVTIDGTALSILRERSPQWQLIDNVTVTGATGGALELIGGNFLVGPGNVLQGSDYPVQVGGGLLPGSVIPTTGNASNYILAIGSASHAGKAVWPPLAVPYLVDGLILADQDILPGAAVRFTAGSGLLANLTRLTAKGLPEAPIVFEPHDGQWLGIWYVSNGAAPRLDHCIVEGSESGVIADDTTVRLENCELRSNVRGVQASNGGIAIVRKSRILDNSEFGVRATDQGTGDLLGLTNPNTIQGNGQGVVELDPGDSLDARFNYWGDPGGPEHAGNPGGQGDSAGPNVLVEPFLTAPPDFDDHPPVVRLREPSFYANPGETLILHWDAFDDGEIVSQRVLYAPHFGLPQVVLAEDLAGDARSVALTVPDPVFSVNGNDAIFTVITVDDAGQEGLDEAPVLVPFYLDASVEVYTDLSGPFTPGLRMELELACVPGGCNPYMFFDATGDVISLGAGTSFTIPHVSTDLARIGVFSPATYQYFFTDYFTIRPDERIGDAPPAVTLTSPAGGSFSGGSIVPVSWSATDDESVRLAAVHASYDGGTAWSVLASDLPGETTSFDWTLPPLDEVVSDVLVRVVVFDHRLQSSSATSAPIMLAPGGGAVPCPSDCADGNGMTDTADLLALLAGWGGPGDCDTDGGGVDTSDLLALLASWGPCPD